MIGDFPWRWMYVILIAMVTMFHTETGFHDNGINTWKRCLHIYIFTNKYWVFPVVTSVLVDDPTVTQCNASVIRQPHWKLSSHFNVQLTWTCSEALSHMHVCRMCGARVTSYAQQLRGIRCLVLQQWCTHVEERLHFQHCTRQLQIRTWQGWEHTANT